MEAVLSHCFLATHPGTPCVGQLPGWLDLRSICSIAVLAGPLTVVEVTGAENDIVKVVQNGAFPKEVDRTSPIHDLNLSFH